MISSAMRRRLMIGAGVTLATGAGLTLANTERFHSHWMSRFQAINQSLYQTIFFTKHAVHARSIYQSVRGDVLDLNVGSGSHITLLPDDVVYSCVEPNAFLFDSLTNRSIAHGMPVGTIAIACNQSLNLLKTLPSNSKDAIISTFALSQTNKQSDNQSGDQSVRAELLDEIHRVLKPGGKLYAVEHTNGNNLSITYSIDDTGNQSTKQSCNQSIMQTMFTPISRALLGNMHLGYPIAAELLAQSNHPSNYQTINKWDQVYIECWNGAVDRFSRNGITQVNMIDQSPTESTDTAESIDKPVHQQSQINQTIKLSGISGMFPVIGVIAVKHRSNSLSSYVRENETTIDDIFAFGIRKKKVV